MDRLSGSKGCEEGRCGQEDQTKILFSSAVRFEGIVGLRLNGFIELPVTGVHAESRLSLAKMQMTNIKALYIFALLKIEIQIFLWVRYTI